MDRFLEIKKAALRRSAGAGGVQGVAGGVQAVEGGVQGVAGGVQGVAGRVQGVAGGVQAVAGGVQGVAGGGPNKLGADIDHNESAVNLAFAVRTCSICVSKFVIFDRTNNDRWDVFVSGLCACCVCFNFLIRAMLAGNGTRLSLFSSPPHSPSRNSADPWMPSKCRRAARRSAKVDKPSRGSFAAECKAFVRQPDARSSNAQRRPKGRSVRAEHVQLQFS